MSGKGIENPQQHAIRIEQSDPMGGRRAAAESAPSASSAATIPSTTPRRITNPNTLMASV